MKYNELPRNIKKYNEILRNTMKYNEIPRNILNRCQVFSFKRPTKGEYIKATSKTLMNGRDIKSISNIKNIKGKIHYLSDLNKVICNKILDKILNYQDIKFLEMRDNLYEIFIFNLDIHSCLYYIINQYSYEKFCFINLFNILL